MEKVSKPKVKTLASGTNLVAKQMAASEGELLPKHSANIESIMFIHEGECILNLGDQDHHLKPGDAIIVPPDVPHQFKAITDFNGVHFMPKDIQFEFF